MSDVTVSVVESTTSVTVSGDVVDISVVESPVTITTGTSGPQGASYNQGDPIYVTVRNATGATLAKGTIVYISGSNGNHVQVTPAIATSDATSARTLGWLSESIANNASGLCQVEGYLEGLNTQGLTSGSQLYLSGTTAGSYQVTKPQAPIHLVYVGVVTKVSAGDGHVFVKVQNGYELDEIHDVQITSVADGDLLEYEAATDLWKNVPQSSLSIAQSQVTNLVTDLAGKANLAGGNAFTGSQTVTSTDVGQFPLSIIPISGQTASTFRVRNAANTGDLFSVDSSGNLRSPALINLSTFNNSRLQMQNTGVLIDTQIATNLPLAVRAASGQTENIQVWQSSAPGTLARVSQNGSIATSANLAVGQTAITNANQFQVTSTTATNIGAVIRGAASQTADLLQLQNSAAVSRFYVTADGTFATLGNGVVSGDLRVGTATYLSSALNVIARATTEKGLVVRGQASQTANLQEWQESTASVNSAVNQFGQMRVRTFGASINDVALASFAAYAAEVPLLLKGAASQTGSLVEIRNSSNTLLSYCLPNGDWVMPNLFNSYAGVGTGYSDYQGSSTSLYVRPTATTRSGAVIKGLASQTANLQEWQNSAGTVVANMQAGGNLKASNVATLNSLIQLAQANSGGVMIMGRQTAQYSSPGANSAALYFRDGTTTGTLKLVVRAGAAGAETTILDNIPQ